MHDIHDEVLKISGKLDSIRERNVNADLIHNDHEKRLRDLEKWRYALPLSALGSLLSAMASGAAILLAVYKG